MAITRKLSFVLVATMLLFGSLVPALSFAADEPKSKFSGPPESTIISPGGSDFDAENADPDKAVSGVKELLERVITWVYTILLTLAVLMFLYAAYLYMFGGGTDLTQKAHKIILYAIIALIVAFLARGFVFLIQELLSAGTAAVS